MVDGKQQRGIVELALEPLPELMLSRCRRKPTVIGERYKVKVFVSIESVILSQIEVVPRRNFTFVFELVGDEGFFVDKTRRKSYEKF